MAAIVIACAFFFALVLARRWRFFSLFPILLAVLVAYAVATALTLAGAYAPGAPGAVHFAAVAAAPWLRDPRTLVFPWGPPRFHLGFLLATLASYMASIIESFGDYYAVARAADEPEPSAGRSTAASAPRGSAAC